MYEFNNLKFSKNDLIIESYICFNIKTDIMSLKYKDKIDAFMAKVLAKDAHEPVFIQAVREVAEAIIPFIENNPKYKNSNLLERMIEPERTIIFRYPGLMIMVMLE